MDVLIERISGAIGVPEGRHTNCDELDETDERMLGDSVGAGEGLAVDAKFGRSCDEVSVSLVEMREGEAKGRSVSRYA